MKDKKLTKEKVGKWFKDHWLSLLAIVGGGVTTVIAGIKFGRFYEEGVNNATKMGIEAGKELGAVEMFNSAIDYNNTAGMPYEVINDDTHERLLVMRPEMLTTYADAAAKSMKKE